MFKRFVATLRATAFIIDESKIDCIPLGSWIYTLHATTPAEADAEAGEWIAQKIVSVTSDMQKELPDREVIIKPDAFSISVEYVWA